ncbi:MAG: L-fucose/L-arabinose isomerase family protein [Anaerolineae bacterium]|nr:L-fucose/L-arabinose isomerase family protein [Anaerolineae bacterium]
MQQVTLGFVPLARTTFDIPLAEAVTGQVRAALEAAGFTLTGPDGLVTSLEEARAAAAGLSGEPLDMLLVFQATFADSTMIMALAEQVRAPLLLWAVPEARTGGRLRLNSLCGINLGGHALTRAGYRYDYVYAAPDGTAALEKVRVIAQAGSVLRRLGGAKVGRIGENPDGFESCLVSWDGLKSRLGVEVQQVALEDVFGRVRAVAPERVDGVLAALAGRVAGLQELDQPALRGTLGTYLSLQEMAGQQGFDGLAVRCWPQFFTDLGCAACGALSLLNDELIPAACETDVNGAITQLMLQWLSGEPAFGTDMVAFDTEADAAVLWHCGKAPLSMCDPAFQPRGTIHSNRQLPLLMEFPLRPGRVTVARLSEANGEFRLVVGSGEMLPSELSFSGTSGLIRFDRPAPDVLDTIMTEGLEHHVALTYGDFAAPLVKLAELLGFPVLRL